MRYPPFLRRLAETLLTFPTFAVSLEPSTLVPRTFYSTTLSALLMLTRLPHSSTTASPDLSSRLAG